MPGFAGFGEGALRSMERYHWPGNVRQFRSEVLHVAAMWPDGREVPRWIPPARDDAGAAGSPAPGGVYFYELRIPGERKTSRLVLLP